MSRRCARAALTAGAIGYFAKPFADKVLLDAVARRCFRA
jgi:FixJ family two-component response regulator